MIHSVLVLHRVDDAGNVVELLLILCLGPLVLPFRKELLVILDRVIVGVEKVLDIVEPYDIVLLLGKGRYADQKKKRQKKYFFHYKLNIVQYHQSSTDDSTSAATLSPILSGRLTKKSYPSLLSSASMLIDWFIIAFLSSL